ncbi:MAG: hypothetical protein ACI4J1_05430 [Ruminiclostridium sp.]
MKQDDFEAAVRKYTEELMRYNAKRAKTDPASKPPAAEKTIAEEKPAVSIQPKPVREKAETAEPAEEQEIVFTPSVESVVEEQEEETEEQQREEQQESIITEHPDPTEEQLEKFAAEQSHQEEMPEETAPEQPEAVEETPEEIISQPSHSAPKNQLPPTADEFVEQNTEPETENPEEEAAEENPLSRLEADEDFEEIAPEEFIDIPEEEKLEQRYKGRGVLKVTAITADGTMPLENVVIKISYESENGDELYAVARTGISGQIEPVTLPAPVSDQNAKDVLFAPYTITAQLSGYTGVSITNVPIFDGQITSQTFNLAPLPLGTESGNMDIVSEEPKF